MSAAPGWFTIYVGILSKRYLIMFGIFSVAYSRAFVSLLTSAGLEHLFWFHLIKY